MDRQGSRGTRSHSARSRTRVRRRRKRPWHRRRHVRIGLAIAAAVAFLLLLDGIWAATTVRRNLNEVRDDLALAADALSSGALEDARARFALAGERADSALAGLGHPSVLLVKWLPYIGDDVRAVEAFGRMGVSAAAAGSSLVDAAEAVGWSGSGTSVLGSNGRFELDGISAAAPPLAEAASLMRRAQRAVADIDPDGLVGPVRDATVQAQGELTRLASLTTKTATLTRVLPDLLGGQGERRYLIAVMTLADPRGSGGYPGAYGVLTARDGKLDLTDFGPMGRLGDVAPPVRSQREPQARYVGFGALTHFIATTYSPDFPRTGALLADMWETADRPAVDGVIAVDSVWLSYLLEAMGPVSVPGQEQPATSDNISTLLNRTTYEMQNTAESDAYQTALARSLFQAIVNGQAPPQALGTSMSRAAAERHFQMFAVRPEEQTALVELGTAGTFDLGAVPLAVAWQGVSPTRAGYFATKTLDFRAEIAPDGSADVTIDVTMRNGAPSGPPSILLGFPGSGRVGHYATNANIYLPADAQDITSAPVNGVGFVDLIQEEFGRPVSLQALNAPSGGSMTVRTTYSLPPDDDPERFTVDVTPLPALNPDAVTVELVLTDGSAITDASGGADVDGSTATWSGAPTTPTTIWVSR